MEYLNIIKGELKKGVSAVKDRLTKTELQRKLKGAGFDPIKLHKINYWTSDVNFNYNTYPEKEY